jgi:flagellin
MLTIANNISALNAQRNLGVSQRALSMNLAHLSSGLRINDASDDAAGLALSEQMRAQISSLSQAQRNGNDGISMVQVASGAMNQQAQILTRMRELAVQASNDSLDDPTRAATVDKEFQALVSEVDRIAKATKFNGVSVMTSATALDFQIGADNNANNRITVTTVDVTATGLGLTGDVTTKANAQTAIDTVDAAIKTLSQTQATFGAAQNRMQAAVDNAASEGENISAAESRIRDVDVAAESAAMSRNQVLVQAGTAILAQANQLPQAAMTLLRS